MASHGISRAATGTAVRTEEARQKELESITKYKDLVDAVNAHVAEKHYTVEVLGLVTRLLHENPEYYTIWNHRRRILNHFISPEATVELSQTSENLIHRDLQLTFTLLRKFPKCYWIWNHRDWLLHTAETKAGSDAASQLWAAELQLVSKMLQADSRNFHAWGYRREVIAQMSRLGNRVNASQSITESEFEYTSKMIKANLSNFSAWHNRSKLIPHLLDERQAKPKDRRALLASELDLICKAINTDPFDQSIWFYHQYLMYTLSPSCPQQDLIVQDLTNGERQKYIEHEIEYIQKILEDEADCKWIYETLLFLTKAYSEVGVGTQAGTTGEMWSWLAQLFRLDPLRRGRWQDLSQSLNLQT